MPSYQQSFAGDVTPGSGGNQGRFSAMVMAVGGIPVVDSRLVAEKCGIQHKNCLELIDAHDLTIAQAFGRVAFETGTLQTAGGPQKTRYALLTEDQATFLITLTRNTAQVVAFKVALVKAFRRAKEALENKAKLEALPDTKPFFALIAKLRRKGISTDVSAQIANDMLKQKAVQARHTARQRPVRKRIGTGRRAGRPSVTTAQDKELLVSLVPADGIMMSELKAEFCKRLCISKTVSYYRIREAIAAGRLSATLQGSHRRLRIMSANNTEA